VFVEDRARTFEKKRKLKRMATQGIYELNNFQGARGC
jgi:hypothetical protein